MSDLLHRIKVFLFRHDGENPNYLLLKPDQGLEALWGPLNSELGLGEKLEPAIRQHVRNDLGVLTPGQLIDLKQPHLWTVGDEEVVEWSFGYECIDSLNHSLVEKTWSAFRWEGIQVAYPTLGLEADRQALLRLHSDLSAA